jgi:hypothetical protein
MPKGEKTFDIHVLFSNCRKCNTYRTFSCEKEYNSYIKRHSKVCGVVSVPASSERDALGKSTIFRVDMK